MSKELYTSESDFMPPEDKRYLWTDVMLDIETLGTDGKFVVTQVAIVPFNSSETASKCFSFHINISVQDSVKNGFTVSDDTINWHINNTSFEIWEEKCQPLSVQDASREIQKFIDELGGDINFWATSTLDYQGISNIFDCVGIKNPIRYDKRFCLRTLRKLYTDWTGIKYKNTNTHNAYKDCVEQIKQYREYMK